MGVITELTLANVQGETLAVLSLLCHLEHLVAAVVHGPLQV